MKNDVDRGADLCEIRCADLGALRIVKNSPRPRWSPRGRHSIDRIGRLTEFCRIVLPAAPHDRKHRYDAPNDIPVHSHSSLGKY
jgi:hypothetical protein